MTKMNPRVDAYLNKAKQWRDEFEKLRMIILDCGLNEELKWGKPCYTFDGKNIVIIQGFKEYCAIMFFKGALIEDADGILVKISENVQAGRQVRFKSVSDIEKIEATLKTYVVKAIEIEKAGLEVEFKTTSDFEVPEELQNKFDEIPELKTAFEQLTPGRQRAYLFYFSQAKQSKTRISRIEKYQDQILNGKGLND